MRARQASAEEVCRPNSVAIIASSTISVRPSVQSSSRSPSVRWSRRMSGAPPVPPDADGLGQHVAVAVRGEVPCGDLPLVGHLLRQGMIAGQLLELAPAEQVGLAALYRV